MTKLTGAFVRTLSSDDELMIKATTVAAYEAVDGVSEAARLLGVASSTLTKYGSTGEEWKNSFIRLDLAIELDRRTDHAHFTTLIGNLAAKKKTPSFGDITAAAILKMDRVLDDVVREIATAIDDGHVDAAERLAVRERINAAQQCLARLDAIMIGVGR